MDFNGMKASADENSTRYHAYFKPSSERGVFVAVSSATGHQVVGSQVTLAEIDPHDEGAFHRHDASARDSYLAPDEATSGQFTITGKARVFLGDGNLQPEPQQQVYGAVTEYQPVAQELATQI